MSGDGVGANSARSGASDGAVLFDRQYVWPGDLTEIPDWVYTDEAIYQREIERIFHGPTWNYVALEAEIPNAGDFIRSHVGPTPVVVARTSDANDSLSTHGASILLPEPVTFSLLGVGLMALGLIGRGRFLKK